jgi:two-component system, chemotaxis family, chemotaxis protein CheY
MIKKVLLVDDSPISRKMMKSCLPKEREFEIFEAGDGLAGLESYKQNAPDVTFMDLTMPVMDGVQSLHEIIKFDKDAVVIVCTADVQVRSLDKVRETGAFHIVKKPPSKESINQALALVEGKNK